MIQPDQIRPQLFLSWLSNYIRIKKTDNKTAVIAKDSAIFDAPVYREKEYDYDESEGVIDEYESVIVC